MHPATPKLNFSELFPCPQPRFAIFVFISPATEAVLQRAMRIHVFFHDHCFDGACSAAFFTRFYRGCRDPHAEFAYTGMSHGPDKPFLDDTPLDGDENAVVDFKYTPSPRLDWWFDHHESAFLSPEDQAHFERDKSGKKFFDPSFKSCTKFIATVSEERFGFRAPDLEDLVRWADIVDGALYTDSATAVSMRAPATKLTLVIEAAKDETLMPRLIPLLASRTLEEIVAQPEIQNLFQPLYALHLESIDVIRSRASCEDAVIFFDLGDIGMEGYNKFIPYDLFPQGVYSVSVTVMPGRTKISVGSNPWNNPARMHNLAKICERYGGGGHAKVGAISLPPGALERARAIAAEVVALLKTPA